MKKPFKRVYDKEMVFKGRTEALEYFQGNYSDFKRGLTESEAIKMSSYDYDGMLNWASTRSKQFNREFVRYPMLSFTKGIHRLRPLPRLDNEPFVFENYVAHSIGQGPSYRKWLCWDFLADNKRLGQYLLDEGILSEKDAKKMAQFGCPTCSTMDYLGKYYNRKELLDVISFENKALLNVWYIEQMHPKRRTENSPNVQLYIWNMSTRLLEDLCTNFKKEIMIDGVENPVSIDNARNLIVDAKGEGHTGHNPRRYAIEFRGEPGPLVYELTYQNRTGKVKAKDITKLKYVLYNKETDEETIEECSVYDLKKVVGGYLTSYQATIDYTKQAFAKVLDTSKYQIPGEEVSDNPLDDNYQEKPDRSKDRKKFEQLEKEAMKRIIEEEDEEDVIDDSDKAPWDEKPSDKTNYKRVQEAKQKRKEEVLSDNFEADEDDWLKDEPIPTKPSKPGTTKPKNIFEEMVDEDDSLDEPAPKRHPKEMPKKRREVF